MVEFGNFIIYIMMVGVLIGAAASVYDSEKGLGKEFVTGIHTIGPVFLAQAGIMASIPILSNVIETLLGPSFEAMSSDAAIAALAIIAVDMGGYQLADAMASTREAWITAAVAGYFSGAVIVYLIPVGLTMLPKKDHKYLALGAMAGLASVPLGVIISMVLTVYTNTPIRDIISTNSEASYMLVMDFGTILGYVSPLIVFCLVLALGLKFFTKQMIKGFLVFGVILDIWIKGVLAIVIVEYFTGVFSSVFGGWVFLSLFADEKELFRAIEIAGYIGIMLAGTFPMVYLFYKYASKPMEKLGTKIGLTEYGSVGFVMVLANIIATYHMFPKMNARDKVITIAFGVCAQALIGDHLSFTANFQPTMILPILLGKLLAGLFAVWLAIKISVPTAEKLEQEDIELEKKEANNIK
ncbi:MAG TPA: ethanolamine utilization protein EutH [Arcobacter sp.]|nr:ethanolamine utilization protein EutH [Arcobacter sp.]